MWYVAEPENFLLFTVGIFNTSSVSKSDSLPKSDVRAITTALYKLHTNLSGVLIVSENPLPTAVTDF